MPAAASGEFADSVDICRIVHEFQLCGLDGLKRSAEEALGDRSMHQEIVKISQAFGAFRMRTCVMFEEQLIGKQQRKIWNGGAGCS